MKKLQSLPGRTAASGKKCAQKPPDQKRRGEMGEAAFLLKASALGFGVADADFLQLRQELRPDALVFALVFFDGVRFDAQFECVTRHMPSKRSWIPQPYSWRPGRR